MAAARLRRTLLQAPSVWQIRHLSANTPNMSKWASPTQVWEPPGLGVALGLGAGESASSLGATSLNLLWLGDRALLVFKASCFRSSSLSSEGLKN